MATSAIAAAARRAEREIIEHLRTRRATSPETAVPLPELRPLARRRLGRLVHARVVRATDGGYFLDEAMYRSLRSDRLTALAMALLAALALVIAVWLARRARGA
jgi:hypothetical protein